jgi:chromosomal replication initiation ATPase DnaA
LPLLFILRQLAWPNLTLKDIGLHFGIGESGVSQAGRRVAQKVENDKQLKKRIAKISEKMNLSRMKT